MKELEFQEEWLSAYLDDELTVEQRQVVEQRLASDPAAQATLDDLRRVRAMVSKLPGWSGSSLKFTIPNELPGDYDEDSLDQQTVASSDLSTVSDDFDAVPSSLEDPAELQVHSTRAADWGDRSTATNRSWLTWLATAASVLLVLGAGYLFWPSGSLMVSQLDRGMTTAAPMSQPSVNAELDADSMDRMGRDSAFADPSNVAAEFNYRAESSDDSTDQPVLPKMSEPAASLPAAEDRGQFDDSNSARFSEQQFEVPLAGKALEQPQNTLQDGPQNLSMSRAPASLAPGTPSADVASNMFGAASDAGAKDSEGLQRQRASGAPNEKLSLPELNNVAAAELPPPAPANAMADKSQIQLGTAGLGESKQLAEQLATQPAQRARYARSANVSDVNQLQQAAAQTTVFFGQNALKIDAAALSTKADQQPETIPEVLMATLKVDSDKAESLFDTVVTSNQLLTVEEAAIKQNADAAPDAFSQITRTDAKEASADANSQWYLANQFRLRELPAVSSLVLFVTRDEANRILEELKRKGQIDAPVWQVTQRFATESESLNASSVGGVAGGNLAAGNSPAGNLPANAARVAEPGLGRGRAEMDFSAAETNSDTSKAKKMAEVAGADRVILMLNTSAR